MSSGLVRGMHNTCSFVKQFVKHANVSKIKEVKVFTPGFTVLKIVQYCSIWDCVKSPLKIAI